MTVCSYFHDEVPSLARRALVWTLSFNILLSNLAYALPEGFSAITPGSTSTYDISNNGTAGVVTQSLRVERFNWDAFNINSNEHLHFSQLPAGIAINYDLNGQRPSDIAGRLTADGSVMLINRNGILFRDGAQIDVGRNFVASALEPNVIGEISEYSLRQAMDAGQPTFIGGGDGMVLVESGASLRGEKVMLFAPRIENDGSIVAASDRAEGIAETVIAAGDEIYLISPESQQGSFDGTSGFLIEVSGEQRAIVDQEMLSGTVENSGSISAERGTVSLVGLAINQNGRVTATAATNKNGIVRLLARGEAVIGGDTALTTPFFSDDNTQLVSEVAVASQTGTLTLGQDSLTAVVAERYDSDALYIDASEPNGSGDVGTVSAVRSDDILQAGSDELQVKPSIELVGETVTLSERASVVAEGGRVDVTAVSSLENDDRLGVGTFVMEQNAVIDVSGTDDTVLPMGRNSIAVDGTGVTLADSILQRDGPARRQTLYLDGREYQEDTRSEYLAVENSIELVERSAAERLINGGDVSVRVDGQFEQHRGASINASGGSKRFETGELRVSYLVNAVEADQINYADPGQIYGDVVDRIIRSPGFSVGGDAGSISIETPNAIIAENGLIAEVIPGEYQSINVNTAPEAGSLSLNLGNFLSEAERHSQNFVIATESFYRDHTEALLQDASRSLSRDTTVIPDDLLRDGGFSEFDAVVPGSVRISDGATVTMRPGGELSIVRTNPLINDTVADATGRVYGDDNAIDIAGDVVIRGGDVNFSFIANNNAQTGLVDNEYAFALRDGATIDTSGLVVKSLGRSDIGSNFLTNAGSITIDVDGSILMEQGTRVMLDAGAEIMGARELLVGEAGDFTINTSATVAAGVSSNSFSPDEAPHLFIDSLISAIGDGKNTLSIVAPGFSFGDDLAQPGDDHYVNNGVQVTLALLAAGFSNFDFNFYSSGTRFQAGQYQLRNRTWVNNQNNLLSVADNARIRQLATSTVVPRFLDQGVDFSVAGNNVGPLTVSDRSAADIVVGDGVSIESSPESSFTLSQNIGDSDILFDGRYRSSGADVEFDISGPQGANQANGVVFGRHSLLDVSGEIVTNSESGYGFPRVVDAGSIALSAIDAFVIQNSGSLFDLSGDSKRVRGLYQNALIDSIFTPVAATGQVLLDVTDTPILLGSVNANPVPGELGGSLSISMERLGLVGEPAGISPNRLPAGAGNELETPNVHIRQNQVEEQLFDQLVERDIDGDIVSVRSDAWSVIDASPSLSNNQVVVSTEWLDSSGFGVFSVFVPNAVRPSTNNAELFGELRIDADVSLSDFAALDFDVHTVSVLPSVQNPLLTEARLQADWFALGRDQIDRNDAIVDAAYAESANPELGSQQLAIEAGFIDLMGNLSFRGVDAVQFSSDSTIRLRSAWGDFSGSASALTDDGSIRQQYASTMRFPETVRFIADQIQTGTGDNVTVRTGIGAEHEIGERIEIESVNLGRGIVAPLAVNSRLAFESQHISQSGNIVVPNGVVEFVTPEDDGVVELLPGSVTSVSLGDKSALFGEVKQQSFWVYELNDSSLAVGLGEEENTDAATQKLPEKIIRFTGNELLVAGDALDVDTLRSAEANAIVDLSGGGNIVGYDFVPGVGGTKDVLDLSPEQHFSGSNLQGGFAILPSERDGVAPADVALGGSTEGFTVTFAANTAGVPEGTYTVLPARYAMLPGAYYVQWSGGQTPYLPSAPGVDALGSMTLAGRLNRFGGESLSNYWTAFTVESSSLINQRSHYDLYNWSEFFQGVDSVGLTNDAGVAQFSAGSGLELNGIFRAEVGDSLYGNGRGFAIDIVADDIELVHTLDETSSATQITLESLSEIKAESLLLGGLRSSNADQFDVDTLSSSISIQESDDLLGTSSVLTGSRSILLVANNDISIGDGATIDTGAESVVNADVSRRSIGIDPNTVLLRVSSEQQADLRFLGEVNSSNSSILNIAEGATISGAAGVAMYARDGVSVDALDALSTPSLNLAAPSVSIGDPEDLATISGTVLGSSLFSDLASNDIEELIITSASAIDFYHFRDADALSREVSVNVAGDLSLVASSFRGMEDGVEVMLSADRVSLRAQEAPGQSVSLSPIDNGTLAIEAGEFVFGQLLPVTDIANDLALSGWAEISLAADERVVLGDISLDLASISSLPNVSISSPLITMGNGTDFWLGSANQVVLHGQNPSEDYQRNIESVGYASSVAISANSIVVDSVVDSIASDMLLEARTSASDIDSINLTENAIVNLGGDYIELAGESFASQRQATFDINAGVTKFILQEGATVDVSGPLLGGVVNLSSQGSSVLAGTLHAGADLPLPNNGGILNVDVTNLIGRGTVSGFSAVASAMQQGGFTTALTYRQRQGDIALSNDDSIRAEQVTLVADQGGIDMSASVDASGIEGGRVAFYAQHDINISAASNIDVSAYDADSIGSLPDRLLTTDIDNGDAGHVAISSRTGVVAIGGASGASQFMMNPRGSGRHGELAIFASHTETANGNFDDLNVEIINTDITSDARVRFYNHLDASSLANDGVIDAADVSQLDALAAAHMQSVVSNNVLQRLLDGFSARVSADIAPHLMIATDGDLAIASEVNTLDWRYGGDFNSVGQLTVLASGNLRIEANVSDGVQLLQSETIACGRAFCGQEALDGESWSFEFVSGADVDSADWKTLLADGQLQANAITLAGDTLLPASTLIANDVHVRTGTGNLALYSAGDLWLESESSAVYTVGRAVPRTSTIDVEVTLDDGSVVTVEVENGLRRYNPGAGSIDDRADQTGLRDVYGMAFHPAPSRGQREFENVHFGDDGGDIVISAAGSIGTSVDTVTTPYDWYKRYGGNNLFDPSIAQGASVDMWAPSFTQFGQAIGVLGGGDLIVNAGGDVQNIGFAAPTAGKQIGNISINPAASTSPLIEKIITVNGESITLPLTNIVDVLGGGDVSISAGGNFNGNYVLVDKGRADISVAGSFGVDRGQLFIEDDVNYGNRVNPSLINQVYIGDASVAIAAEDDVNIDFVTNTSVIESSAFATAQRASSSYYFNYSDSSTLSVNSFGGDVRLAPAMTSLNQSVYSQLRDTGSENVALLSVLPGSLIAHAHLGDFLLDSGTVTLFPADNPTIEIAIGGDMVDGSINDSGGLRMANGSALNLPLLISDASNRGEIINGDWVSATGVQMVTAVLGDVLLPSLSNSAIPSSPVNAVAPVLIAVDGAVAASAASGLSYSFSRPAKFSVGEDVIGVGIEFQNGAATDVSSLIAGGDIIVNSSLANNGLPRLRESVGISIDGPGGLNVLAGGDIDLGASVGIFTPIGASKNPFLPNDDANINLLAGVSLPEISENDAFNQRYIYDSALLLGFAASGGLAIDMSATNYHDLWGDGVPDNAEEARLALVQLIADSTEQSLALAREIANRAFDESVSGIKTQLVLDQFYNELSITGQEQVGGQGEVIFASSKLLNNAIKGINASYESSVDSIGERAASVIQILSEEDVRSRRVSGDWLRGFSVINSLFPGSTQYPGSSLVDANDGGSISLTNSKLETNVSGDIKVLAPYGSVDVGLSVEGGKDSDQLGFLSKGTGNISVYSRGDINVNQSRVFALDGGSALLFSSDGDINAGIGARDIVSIPEPRLVTDNFSNLLLQFPAAIEGSGVKTECSSDACDPSSANIGVYAPKGAIDGGDAGITSGGELTIGAPTILNAEFFQAGEDIVGIPDAEGAELDVPVVEDSDAEKAVEEELEAVETEDAAGNKQIAFVTIDVLKLLMDEADSSTVEMEASSSASEKPNGAPINCLAIENKGKPECRVSP